MKLDTLKKLYLQQLKDLHSAEIQLVEALPRMCDEASARPLRDAFSTHLEETKQHAVRIESIFEQYEFSPRGHRCAAMAGLVREMKDLLGEEGDPKVRDAAMVCAAQKIEHYEIGSYGCVRAYAKILGDEEGTNLIEETLREERAADHTLTEMAEEWINAFAATASAS